MLRLEEINAFLDSFYKPLNADLVELRKTEKDYIPYIRKQTENFIGLLLSISKPDKILELGTAIGYSAIYMAEKSPVSMVYTIERDEKSYEEAVKNIKSFGLEDRIIPFLGDCKDGIDKLYEECIRDIDFVFIDAAKSHYREFIDSIVNIIKPGAIILSDDVFQRGITVTDDEDPEGKHRTSSRNMREYLEYITEDPRFETAILNLGDGLAFTLYKG